jgi:ABC-type lipoprotein release transport system permease subunit
MLVLKLSLRNIISHKRRSLIIFIIMAIVACLTYLFMAFSDGEIENFRKGFSLLRYTAHILAAPTGFKAAQDRYEDWDTIKAMTIEDYKTLRRELMDFEFIKTVYNLTYTINQDIFVSGKRFNYFRFNGLEPGYAEHVTSKLDIVEGDFFTKDQENMVLFNILTKDELKAEPGDTISIVGKDVFGQAVVEDFTLAGYFKSRVENPNLATLSFVDINGYALISGYYADEATRLNIDLKKGFSVPRALSILNDWAEQNQKQVEFHDFYTIYENDDNVYTFVRIIMIVVCIIVILIVMVGIMNVVAVNLFDRRKEVGTYYCLGTEKSTLVWIYTLEILFVNLAATLSGIGLGAGISAIINALKISTADPGLQLVLGGSVFHLGYSLDSMLWISGCIIIITLLTALTTMGSSLKVSPSAAMRETEQ